MAYDNNLPQPLAMAPTKRCTQCNHYKAMLGGKIRDPKARVKKWVCADCLTKEGFNGQG